MSELLTPDERFFENNNTGRWLYSDIEAGFHTTSDQSHSGSYSLDMAVPSSYVPGSWSAWYAFIGVNGPGFPEWPMIESVEGQTYTLSGWAWVNDTFSLRPDPPWNCYVAISFWDQDYNWTGTTYEYDGYSPFGWMQLTASGVAPAGAKYVQPIIACFVTGVGPGESLGYFDDLSFTQTATPHNPVSVSLTPRRRKVQLGGLPHTMTGNIQGR